MMQETDVRIEMDVRTERGLGGIDQPVIISVSNLQIDPSEYDQILAKQFVHEPS